MNWLRFLESLVKSPDNPSGEPLAELLRRIRLEVEGYAACFKRGHPAFAPAVQVAGLLLSAEGVHEAATLAGHAFDSFPPPRLVPPARV